MLTRRHFLQTGASILAGATLFPALSRAAAPAGAPRLTLPTPAQLAWQDCEVGVIYHFDLPVAAGDRTGNNAVRKTFDPNLYQPRQLDTDQWLEAAKACGARYALFTATHFNGFMQWQSDLYPYGLKQTTWRRGKGDVVADFVTSCRKAGIKPGIYFSIHRNVYNQVWSHYVGREVQRRWGHPIATTSGRGPQLELKLPTASRIASVVLMEDIAHGERIQNYTLSGQRPGGQWQEIARGRSVGHKRIEQFAPIEVTALRLTVNQAKAEARLRQFAAYA